MGARVAYLINWGLISSWRRVCILPVRRPFLPTFGWLLITGALCDLAIVGSLIFGTQVGVPALIGCLAAAVAMIRSPYRWQRWHKVLEAHESGTLWVPETRRTSCDLLILVEQSAESVPPSDVVDPGSGPVGKWS